jgi:hypothetical protein
VREDLARRQKLNVVAFLVSGVVGAKRGLVGEPYEDAGNVYNPLLIQPTMVLSADQETLKAIYRRAMERGVRLSLHIENIFTIGHDVANHAVVKQYTPEATDVVGLALREEMLRLARTPPSPKRSGLQDITGSIFSLRLARPTWRRARNGSDRFPSPGR